MPRVTTRTRSNRGTKTYKCVKCRKPIVQGEAFHQWTFRYGGTRYKHAECGYPRPSELTLSRKGEVYAAVEDIQDQVASEDFTLEDIVSAIDEAASLAQEIADEFRSTADEYFGGGGAQAALADEMEEAVGELESASSDVGDVEVPGEDEDGREGHEVVRVDHGDGTVTLKCETCDVEIKLDQFLKDLGLTTPGTAKQDDAVAAFEEAHPSTDEEEADESDWREEVREIVSGISA